MKRLVASHAIHSALSRTPKYNRVFKLINSNNRTTRSFHSQRNLKKDEEDKTPKSDDIVEDAEEEKKELKDEEEKPKDSTLDKPEETDTEIDPDTGAPIAEIKKWTSQKEDQKEEESILPSGYREHHGMAPDVEETAVPKTVTIIPVAFPLIPGGVKLLIYPDHQMFSTVAQKFTNREKIGIFALKPGRETVKVPTIDDFENVGTLGQILKIHSGDEQHTAVIALQRRIKFTDLAEEQPKEDRPFASSHKLPVVNITSFGDDKYMSVDDQAKFNDVRVKLNELTKFQTLNRDNIIFMLKVMGNSPSSIIDNALSMHVTDRDKLQQALSSETLKERLDILVDVLRLELEVQRVHNQLNRKLDEKISGYHRKQILTEKFKIIKSELGLDQDDKTKEKFLDRIKGKTLPEAAQKAIDEELNKLSTLEPSSSEFNVSRNYLEWLTVLPWGTMAQENFDLAHARKVLDDDHYGLQKLKERILEFIAVGKRKGTVQGKILCFVGPPGVGKTSIGKSIASALKREYFRFSVGGVHDVAEIKGHRRTYIGAMPGKLIQCLKQAKSMNPVILIDEIDKMGKSPHGDPQSALLEVLDPEQNDSFLDHYLDVPFDLSKVLFVCTANVLDTIPGPLLDRMEVLRISGYIEQEKMNIAKKYLIPKVVKDTGVEGEVTVTDKLLQSLIRDYCRESGCRNLQKHIERIYRKAAYKLVVAEEKESKKNAPKEEDSEKQADSSSILPSSVISAPPGSTSVTDILPSQVSDVSHVEPDDSGIKQVPLEVVEQKAEQEQLERGKTRKIRIQEKNLEEYVGHPNFSSDRYYFTAPSGVVMGLAWTSMGGSTLYIESRVELGKEGHLKVTGKLGDVMKESSSIAYTFAKSYYDKIIKNKKDVLPFVQNHLDQLKRDREEQKALEDELDEVDDEEDVDDGAMIIDASGKRNKRRKRRAQDFFSKYSIHMHVPEGATPKDGPSAGITMVTSLLSLAYDRPIRHGLAMTGEITLTGKVLAIGGVKEKTIAARRSGVVDMILPQECRREWEELDKKVREGINVHFVDYYDDVHKIAFEYDDVTQQSMIEADRVKIKKESPKLAQFYKL